MSRKPAHELRPTESRQAIWDWIRAYKAPDLGNVFSVNDIARDVLLNPRSISDYLTGLVNAGFLNLVPAECTSARPVKLYVRIKDNGREAPRVRKDGTAVTMGLAREKMWTAMGIRAQKGHTFTCRDLTAGSTKEVPVSETDAKSYCFALHRMGRIIEVERGTSGQPTVYRMPRKNWTGPKPVQIQRTKRGFDPNTGETCHLNVISVEGGE